MWRLLIIQSGIITCYAMRTVGHIPNISNNLIVVPPKRKNKCTLFGTIDPSGVITYGSLADVEQKTLELLKLYRGCPRLVVNAGCAIPREAPHENVKRLVDMTHEWCD